MCDDEVTWFLMVPGVLPVALAALALFGSRRHDDVVLVSTAVERWEPHLV